MNILLLHPKTDIREMLTFPLEGSLSAVTMGAANEPEGRAALIDKKFNPDIIVAENSPAILQMLQNLLLENPLSTKLILCDNAKSGNPPPMPGVKFLGFALYENLVQSLVDLIQGQVILGQIVESAPTAGEGADYCRINTSLLLKVNPLAADVFIRLSPTHFVKMFNQNDTFEEDDLKRYREKKKVDYLYLRNSDCPLLIGKLIGELEKMLSASAPPTTQNAAETVESAVETIHALINKFGVTEEVQKAVKSTVQVAMKTMGDFPELADVLKAVNDPNGKYIGRHSMLLTNIACALAVEMDWYSDATFEKLTMAAFMHDAPLQDHDLCAVKSISEFEKELKGKYSLAQIQEYKAHPQKAVLMLGHFKELPAEVDKIILQHHEHPMGSGFPNALTGNYISPLSSLFIVAHDIADFILDGKGKFDVDDFLDIYENKFASGNFKKITKALLSMDFE
jgi:hypothetical protein